MKIMSEDSINAAKNNAAVAAVDSSVKYGYVGGCWMLVNDYDLVEDKNCMWSNKWSQHTALAYEVAVVLDLAQILVYNMKNTDKDSLKVHMYCKKAWELLTSDSLQSSYFSGDGGSIASETIASE